jgi:hypothetical protein
MAGLDNEADTANEVTVEAETEMPEEKNSDDSFTKDPGENTDPDFSKEVEESTQALAWMRTLAGLK